MISPLIATLWITLIGMALIFISVLLLWGLMEALVKFSARSGGDEKHEFSGEIGEDEHMDQLPTPSAASSQKKRATAAAVAIALALRPGAHRVAPPPSTSSAWQAVNRTRQLTQSTHITRKS
ncbi:MAG: hypothetical protein LUO89_05120 [Methanothrix sp.]|nr:hypothetical protein [Methanothrix sp.]